MSIDSMRIGKKTYSGGNGARDMVKMIQLIYSAKRIPTFAPTIHTECIRYSGSGSG